MMEYSFFQDEKVAMWRRHRFSVMAQTQEQAEDIILQRGLDKEPVIKLADGKQIIYDGSRDLLETQYHMAAKENENQDTRVVLTADEEKREICSNADGSEPAPGGVQRLSEDSHSLRKEPYVFLYPADRFSIDATDEQIIADWKDKLPKPTAHITDRWSLQMFFSMPNNGDIDFTAYWVRMIYMPTER